MKNLLLIAASAVMLTACNPYSEGQRTGTVSKISYKGLIPACKSFEGELVMGGLRSTVNSEGQTGVAANIFLYSVKDETVVADLKEAAQTGVRTTLTYDEFPLFEVCGRKTNYVITDVQTVE